MKSIFFPSLWVFHYLCSWWDESLMFRSDLVNYSTNAYSRAFSSSASLLYVLLHFSHLFGCLTIRLTNSSSSGWNFNSLILIIASVTIHLWIALSNWRQFYLLSHLDDIISISTSFSSLATSSITPIIITVSLLFIVIFGTLIPSLTRLITR